MTPSHLESAQKRLPRGFEGRPGSFGLEETQSAFLTRAISRGVPKLPVTGNFLYYYIMARDGGSAERVLPPLGQNGHAVGSPAGMKRDHAQGGQRTTPAQESPCAPGTTATWIIVPTLAAGNLDRMETIGPALLLALISFPEALMCLGLFLHVLLKL